MRGAASRGTRVKSTTSQRYLLKRWAIIMWSLRDGLFSACFDASALQTRGEFLDVAPGCG